MPDNDMVELEIAFVEQIKVDGKWCVSIQTKEYTFPNFMNMFYNKLSLIKIKKKTIIEIKNQIFSAISGKADEEFSHKLTLTDCVLTDRKYCSGNFFILNNVTII